MTLAELVLALSITAVIGASAATMFAAFSYGTSAQSQSQNLLVANELVSSRLGLVVRGSREVLAQGSNYLVLWIADKDNNGKVNVSEMCRLERDPNSNTITLYQAPPNPASDPSYDPNATDFNATTNAVKGSSTFPGTLRASGVTNWTIVLNSAQTQQATFVGWQLTSISSGRSQTTVGGASLRNP
jgi:hypothetical protein